MRTVNWDRFPQHFFERLVRRLRSRHRKPRHGGAPVRTWYRCYKNNRDKLLYRFRYRYTTRNRQHPESPWDVTIWFQQRKIARKHDVVHHWAYTEYRILVRMNEGLPEPVRPLVWRFAASIQVSKVNRMHRTAHEQAERYLTWRERISRSYWIGPRKRKPIGENPWEVAIRANKKKLVSLLRGSVWHDTIYEQSSAIQLDTFTC